MGFCECFLLRDRAECCVALLVETHQHAQQPPHGVCVGEGSKQQKSVGSEWVLLQVGEK